jgi:type VI secretion system protein ImpA
MTSLKPFFAPIAGDNPCGKDISYDPAFLNLEILAKGQEQSQFSTEPPPEPNWGKIQETALELLGQSKHLRLGILTTLALLQTEGLQGFANGLALMADWAGNYWDGMFPPLDPEDNNDPSERINLLQSLTSPEPGGDRFLQRLGEVPLAESPKLGRYSAKKAQLSQNSAEIAAAFRDTDPAKLQATYEAATNALDSLKLIQQSISQKVGVERAPNFRELSQLLKDIQSLIAPRVGAPTPTATAATGETSPAPSATGAPGTISNREDVVQALRAICAYYKTNEPASPIPLLLERAQRLVNKEFLEIMSDLAPESMAQINLISGIKPEENK